MINSLYIRLNFAAIVVGFIFLAATGKVLDNAFVDSVYQSLREKMLDQAYQLLASIEVDGAGRMVMPLPVHLPYPQLALPKSGSYAFVNTNPDGQVIWRSPSWGNRPPPALFRLKVGEKSWREQEIQEGSGFYLFGLGFQRTAKSGVITYNLFLMNDMATARERIYQYRQRLWLGLVGVAALLLASQMLMLSWGLAPIRRVSRELNAIEEGEQEAINGNYPAEIKKLTDNINHLLMQERGLQTRYRNALADLAHSLKTPLAVLTGAENMPDFVREQSMRMMRIVERQLQRAGTASCTTVLRPLVIVQVAERLIQSLSKIYSRKQVSVGCHIEPSLSLRCNEADLIEILGNLIDNAFKWCHRRVVVSGSRHGGVVVIKVEDDGPGISPQQIDLILQRGGRADEVTPGHGIGLTVAADIVGAYEGFLRIEASALGGAAVILEFAE